jgi:hypothetical protein
MAKKTKQPLIPKLRGFTQTLQTALPFGRLWYGEPSAISNAIGCVKFYSHSRDAVIRVYDAAGK